MDEIGATLRAMRTGTLIIELGEKMGLLAAAALIAVLFPPLRKRLLGLGHRRDKMVAMAFGLALSVWGALMGLEAFGDHMDIRATGILIGAILGGAKAGILTGVGSGLFYGFYLADDATFWGMFASFFDGSLAGFLASRRPDLFAGARVFGASLLIQLAHTLPIGVALWATGEIGHFVPAWPAHAVQILICAMGVTLFVTVARIMVAREHAAVALVEARAAADTASLDSLRRRLEPHFLFNALNTLRAAIRTDPELARKLVSDLADLYRYLLHHPDDASLTDEVEHAKAYLEIERARLGRGRLHVAAEIPADIADEKVPALLLQPLVENAVNHGIASRSGAGSVQILARKEAHHLLIEVIDRCEGETLGARSPGSGIALATLRARLVKLFDNRASLILAPQPKGMRVTIRLPLAARKPLDGKMRPVAGPHPALWPASWRTEVRGS